MLHIGRENWPGEGLSRGANVRWEMSFREEPWRSVDMTQIWRAQFMLSAYMLF